MKKKILSAVVSFSFFTVFFLPLFLFQTPPSFSMEITLPYGVISANPALGASMEVRELWTKLGLLESRSVKKPSKSEKRLLELQQELLLQRAFAVSA